MGSGYTMYTYSATVTGQNGDSAFISAMYNTYSGLSAVTPTSTPYANPNGAGTCINELVDKLNSTQQQLAGLGSGDGPLSNAVAQVCSN